MIYTNFTVISSTNIYWAPIMSQELGTEQKIIQTVPTFEAGKTAGEPGKQKLKN